jgi:transitional endoplasmic reticulum ATPase
MRDDDEEDAAYAELHALLLSGLSLPYASGILLAAPPGAGKTTLCRLAASATRRPVLPLPHALLAAPAAGDVEAAVSAFFAAACAAAPAVVLLDNVDAVAPATIGTSGAADARAIAALDAAFDALSLDPEEGAGLVILATASYPRDIHPCLTRSGRLSTTVKLHPPDWAQRRRFLSRATDSCADDDAMLDNLASMTPGFLPADLSALMSRARLLLRREPQLSMLQHAQAAIQTVRPILLSSAGASWQAIPWQEDATTRLHGVDSQITALSSCLRAAFSADTTSLSHVLGAVPGAVIDGTVGSGKSALARLAPSFLPRGRVNAFCLDSAEIVGCVVGAAEQKLRGLFALARAASPTVLVVENIDVLAPKRDDSADIASTSSGGAAFQRILSTLLIELDGVILHNTSSSGGAIFVVGTTSDISRVDPAIMRPGRLELRISMTLPDLSAREALLREYIRHQETFLELIPLLAARTDGWSAADLQGLCHESAFLALRDQREEGKCQDIDLVIQSHHYHRALDSLR